MHQSNKTIVVDFHGVSFGYGPIKVLEKACFHIHEGEFVAFVGQNGSGKTTVLKLLLGLLKPAAGKITIGGKTFSNKFAIGYVPQNVPAAFDFPITVADVVKEGRLRGLSRKYTQDDEAIVEKALHICSLSELARRQYGMLSGGQRRRVLVARALAAINVADNNNASLLILDEPAANLDKQSETQLYDILTRLKGRCTILIVTHSMSYVSNKTDRVLCLGEEGYRYSIVEHQTEEAEETDKFHVLHKISFSAEECDAGEAG
ncbi:MAG: ATP-binding cassette domain-containing protein [Spirochaetaceae bacterium]|jgi:zinc transport system ATP-binding protein|nr:ATP-binding cassette domain-containing protein [Spirochaetaceae bacterium]